MISSRKIRIVATAGEHIESFHAALDLVARERRYLTMLEAFPLAETREHVMDMIARGNPHVVAVAGNRVLGWCDITRHFFPAHAHRGSLAMGIVPEFRGQGLGRLLIDAALANARQLGLIRVELSVHADNSRAIALYEKVGFAPEGVLRRAVCIDGRFVDSVSMAIMLDTTASR
ncbi:GNAT family N-acetyltransferase [Rhizobium tumorigenes]|uniref:GNAT family protein n=1 Tax=Rhizobium tumorigenes TaxID=2041385 RepID=A0AAF1K7K2_9HYPH|nr:GNAT family protein [Rhizobium tumorigenes]WFR94131.1 GNAT family protein [Rhizobium tumorigenes]